MAINVGVDFFRAVIRLVPREAPLNLIQRTRVDMIIKFMTSQ